MEQNPYKSPQYSVVRRNAEWDLRSVGFVVAGLLYFVSLGGGTIQSGTDRGFLLGIICLLFGMSYLAWYANPCILISGMFLLSKRFHWAAAYAGIAIALCLSALRIREIEINEAGTMGVVTGYGFGFYLWTASSITLLAASLACLLSRRDHRTSTNQHTN
jgi:hypothetical protein